MFGKKVPFFWFNVPENLRIEAKTNYISFYQEFEKETTGNKIIRYVLTIGMVLFIGKLVNDGLQYKNSASALPIPGEITFIPAFILLFFVISLNIRRRIKLIVFDFNENNVKHKPMTLSFIGTRSAAISSPFNVIIKKNTRERQHSGEDGSWTSFHEGYEIMIKLEKRGHESIMFLETDDIKQDYGELIGKLATVAGIDNPLFEMTES